MDSTSHQPFGSAAPHASSTSPVDPTFSTTAAHATGGNPVPTSASQPADDSLKGKLDSAVASGKKWLKDSGVTEQAQQLPQKAKDLSKQALTSINGLTNTQKAVGVGLLAAAVAFLLTKGGKGKRKAPEYRDRPRKSPFDHQPHTKDGDYAYDRKGQRPWGNSRFGTAAAPAGKPRVASGSGYTSAPASSHSADMGRSAAPSQHASASGASQRRDQGPASGSKYDANTSGSQNPNNIG
ncbi:MAG: hypothetical protein EOO36_05465 [Cytophagaceae bacterium]|nr:MAG: hypothetical protein EOO36_05465 [Cytophagaceae bacterium]